MPVLREPTGDNGRIFSEFIRHFLICPPFGGRSKTALPLISPS
jgi:hypothetical protein